MPGVIEWPARIPEARSTKINAVTSDILPTLCALAGATLPKHPLDGISLLPLLDGTTPLVKLMGCIPTRNFVNHRYTDIRAEDFSGPRVILDNNHKLVIDGEKNSGIELFDLAKDPGETTNLAESHPKLAKDLQSRLSQ